LLRLTRIKRQNELRLYCFEEYSRPDYLARSVILGVDSAFIIRSLRLNSARYGFVAILFGHGVTESTGWENDDEAREQSGTTKHYTVSVTTQRPALLQKVLDDVLSASPSAAFAETVRHFAGDDNQEIPYDYHAHKLEPIVTTDQVHVLRFIKNKPDLKPYPEVTERTVSTSAHAVFRNLNPVYVLGKTYKAIMRSLGQIHYVCTGCGAENVLLATHCTACLAHRPPLKFYPVLLFVLRAAIDISYIVYAIIAISFLIYTVLHVTAH
jgi:ribosomal protein L40E